MHQPLIHAGFSGLRNTLLDRDLLKPGEFIKLGESYYKIADFYSGSGTIELIRIDDIETKVGIQAGAIAPSFKFISTAGDIISSIQYKDDLILIANVSGCSPNSFDGNAYEIIPPGSYPSGVTDTFHTAVRYA